MTVCVCAVSLVLRWAWNGVGKWVGLTVGADAPVEEVQVALAVAIVAGLEEAVFGEGVAGSLGVVDVA